MYLCLKPIEGIPKVCFSQSSGIIERMHVPYAED